MQNYEIQVHILSCLENALYNQRADTHKALRAFHVDNYRVIVVQGNPAPRTDYHWEGDQLVFVVYEGDKTP